MVYYHLSLPSNENRKVSAEVLPIDTPGGPNETFAKPVDTFFEVSIVSAPSSLKERGYELR